MGGALKCKAVRGISKIKGGDHVKKGLVEFFVKRFKGEEEIKRKEKEWREKYKKKYGRWPEEDGACFIIKK